MIAPDGAQALPPSPPAQGTRQHVTFPSPERKPQAPAGKPRTARAHPHPIRGVLGQPHPFSEGLLPSPFGGGWARAFPPPHEAPAHSDQTRPRPSLTSPPLAPAQFLPLTRPATCPPHPWGSPRAGALPPSPPTGCQLSQPLAPPPPPRPQPCHAPSRGPRPHSLQPPSLSHSPPPARTFSGLGAGSGRGPRGSKRSLGQGPGAGAWGAGSGREFGCRRGLGQGLGVQEGVQGAGSGREVLIAGGCRKNQGSQHQLLGAGSSAPACRHRPRSSQRPQFPIPDPWELMSWHSGQGAEIPSPPMHLEQGFSNFFSGNPIEEIC